jgi:hypothetical protein
MSETYVHGYHARENERLQDQAGTLVDLLHSDTAYPGGSSGDGAEDRERRPDHHRLRRAPLGRASRHSSYESNRVQLSLRRVPGPGALRSIDRPPPGPGC